MKERNSQSMILALCLISVASGLLVVFTYQLTLPRIQINRQKAIERAVFGVLPGATSKANYYVDEAGVKKLADTAIGEANVFAGFDAEGRLVGVAMEGSSRGYQDVVKVLFGYSFESECVVGMRVLQSTETPGLGDRVETDPAFLANFDCLVVRLNESGTALTNEVITVKNGKKTQDWEIDGISGATITSNAIGDAIGKTTNVMLPLLAKHGAAMEFERN